MNELPTNPATGSAETPASGSQPTPSRHRRQILAGAALATGLVVGGTAVAAAASNTATLERTASSGVQASQNGAAAGFGAADGARDGRHADGMRGEKHDGKPGGRDGGMRGGMRGALHGELTVPQADGTGTEVILVQRGTVTAVSSTSLSVKSTDGFTSTYTVSSSTRVRAAGGDKISGVKVGATVNVVSTKAKAALMVGGGGDHAGDKGGRMGGQLRPTPSTSATTST